MTSLIIAVWLIGGLTVVAAGSLDHDRKQLAQQNQHIRAMIEAFGYEVTMPWPNPYSGDNA